MTTIVYLIYATSQGREFVTPGRLTTYLNDVSKVHVFIPALKIVKIVTKAT